MYKMGLHSNEGGLGRCGAVRVYALFSMKVVYLTEERYEGPHKLSISLPWTNSAMQLQLATPRTVVLQSAGALEVHRLQAQDICLIDGVSAARRLSITVNLGAILWGRTSRRLCNYSCSLHTA